MTLKRQVAHNTIIQLGGKMIGTLLGLFTVLIMVRYLGAEKFGWYTTAIGFLQFVGIFSDFGFMITSANMLSEPEFDKKRLLNTLFTWRFFTALILQGLSPFLFLLFPYPSEVKIAVAITAISFFATSASQVFSGYYQQQLKTHIITIGEFLGRASLLIAVLLISRADAGFLPIMTAISIGSVINALYLYIKMPKLKFCFDKEITKAIFKKIKPTALCIIFNSFYLQGDRVILPLYVSQSDVGFYGVSYRILDIIVQMAALIMGVIAPLLTFFYSRKEYTNFKHYLQISFDAMILVLLPIMIGANVLAKPIMDFVGKEEFADASKILAYLSLTIIGICFGIVFGYAALSINQQKKAVYIYLSDAILSIIGYFYFIPRLGIYGAAMVTIFSEVYAGLLLMILVMKHSSFQLNIKNTLKISIASAIMFIAISKTPFANLFATIIFGAIIYLAGIIALKVVSKDTIREIAAIKN